jgi:hypothetical protein
MAKVSPGAAASRDTTLTQVDNPTATSKGVYIGVEAGSDLERYGYQSQRTIAADPYARTGPASFSRIEQLSKKPKYKVGYLNSKDFARELGNFDPQAIYTYQQYMNQAGLLDKFSPGVMDAATRGAFKELLTSANQHAGTWQGELDAVLQAGGKTGDTGTSTPPLTVNLTNPDDIKAVATTAAQSLLGQNLSDDQLNNFVSTFQAQERDFQTTSYNQQYTPGVGYGPGGEATQAPDLKTAATNYAKSSDPAQYQTTQFGSMVSDALKNLRSGGYLS